MERALATAATSRTRWELRLSRSRAQSRARQELSERVRRLLRRARVAVDVHLEAVQAAELHQRQHAVQDG